MRILTIINKQVSIFLKKILNILDDYISTPSKTEQLIAMCDSYEDEITRLEQHKAATREKMTELETELGCTYLELYRSQDEVQILSKQCADLRDADSQLSQSLKQANSFSLNHIYSLTDLKQKWLKAMIEDIDNESYAGCGCYYELYEARRQEMLTGFLKRNKDALTDEEIKQFKIDANYIDNFEPYSEYDAELGRHVSIHEIIQQEMV